jgi:hypothetical protein
MREELVGRTGLARILDVTENTTRNLQKIGKIAPEAIISGRPLFSADKARALRAERDAAHAEAQAARSALIPAA